MITAHHTNDCAFQGACYQATEQVVKNFILFALITTLSFVLYHLARSVVSSPPLFGAVVRPAVGEST